MGGAKPAQYFNIALFDGFALVLVLLVAVVAVRPHTAGREYLIDSFVHFPKTRLRSKSIPGRPWPISCAGVNKRSASMHTWANAVLELPHELLEEPLTAKSLMIPG